MNSVQSPLNNRYVSRVCALFRLMFAIFHPYNYELRNIHLYAIYYLQRADTLLFLYLIPCSLRSLNTRSFRIAHRRTEALLLTPIQFLLTRASDANRTYRVQSRGILHSSVPPDE